MKIKTGDTVEVRTGKDKGKRGKVTEVLSDAGRVVVEGVNMKKRHGRPRRQGQQGQIVEFAAPIETSNVSLVDPKTDKATRVGFEFRDGKKVRIAKKSGTAL